MTDADLATLQKLAAWTSPAFPTSAYAYSHGLEQAVAAGDVVDPRTAEAWIEGCVGCGAGRSDLVSLAEAHRAWSARDAARLARAAELATALAISAERRDETLGQGAAFLKTAWTAWPMAADPPLTGDAPLPVALGAVAAAHDAPLAPTMTLAAQAFVSQLASAAQRLVPIGQSDAQTIVARLADCVAETVADALQADPDDVGGCAWAVDVASMRHETQTVRLFRS